MNISFPDLRSFVTLAHCGNFHHAALALAVSQPTLTRRIQKLEETLGIQLFDRTTRNVTLSAVGREFLPKAQALLEELELSMLSISSMAERTVGQVTVACVPTTAQYFMPKVLKVFSAKYPHIKIKIIDETANVVLTSVLAGEADLGIGFGRNLGEDIEFDPLLDDPFVLACRHDHPLAQKDRVDWSELRAYPFIRAGSNNGNRVLIDLTLSRSKSAPNWLYEVQHLSTSLAFVEAGLGISAVSTLLMMLNHNPHIAFRPLDNPTLCRMVGILRRARGTLSPAARNFYAALKTVWVEEAAQAAASIKSS